MAEIGVLKLLVMDVDGTLTDGKINVGENGELFKAFDVKDGYAINRILPQCGIAPVIITNRRSKIVEHRASELHIQYLFQGVGDKLAALSDLLDSLHLSFANCAYIGDDINDKECMMKCALSACPADAVKEVSEIADYVCTKRGGEGAVREFIEYLRVRQKGG